MSPGYHLGRGEHLGGKQKTSFQVRSKHPRKNIQVIPSGRYASFLFSLAQSEDVMLPEKLMQADGEPTKTTMNGHGHSISVRAAAASAAVTATAAATASTSSAAMHAQRASVAAHDVPLHDAPDEVLDLSALSSQTVGRQGGMSSIRRFMTDGIPADALDPGRQPSGRRRRSSYRTSRSDDTEPEVKTLEESFASVTMVANATRLKLNEREVEAAMSIVNNVPARNRAGGSAALPSEPQSPPRPLQASRLQRLADFSTLVSNAQGATPPSVDDGWV